MDYVIPKRDGLDAQQRRQREGGRCELRSRVCPQTAIYIVTRRDHATASRRYCAEHVAAFRGEKKTYHVAPIRVRA